MAATKTLYRKSKALKALEEHIYQAKLQRSSMPDFAVAKPRFEDRTSNGLTKAIVAYITHLGGWASRINTTGRYIRGQEVVNVLGHTQSTRGRWVPGTTKTGTPDIIGNINGVFLGIEIKIGKDRLSEKQKQVREQIEQGGGVYIVARSFSQFKEQIQIYCTNQSVK